MSSKSAKPPRAAPHRSLPNPRHAKPDTVLLAVTGMSPAILTETVWALAQEKPPVLPRRIVAITTLAGRQEIERLLFQPSPRFGGGTPWDGLRQALTRQGLDLSDALRFGTTPDDIRVITAVDRARGRSVELPDIRSPEDNEAAADFLLEQVRALVENPDTHLIASIAGGRKTMGALLYACLTLAGREDDRLTHVLVDEPFDTLRDFFFPGQPGGAVTSRDGQTFEPRSARVQLADVPFVPLRNLFVRELGRKPGSFSGLVQTCRQTVRQRVGEDLKLELDTTRTEILVNGVRVKLAPREHLVLLFLASRAKRGDPALPAFKNAEEPLNEFRTELIAAAAPNNFADWRHGDSLHSPLEDDEVRRALSSLRTKLRSAGGGAPMLAACLPEKGRFSLEVPGPMIFIK